LNTANKRVWRVYYTIEGEPMQHYMDAWHKTSEGAKGMVEEHLDDALRRDGKDREVVEVVPLFGVGDDF